MMTKVELNAPADDQLPFLMPDPRFAQERTTYFSARIVDAESFLAQYAFEARGDAEPLYLRISDRHAEWNEGIYRLSFTDDGVNASVTKLPEAEAPAQEALLSCSIQTLAALLLGYQKAGFMSRIGRLGGTDEQIARLGKAIPQRTTYLMDFF